MDWDDDYDYGDYEDYDPSDHMMNDPVGFQIHGYGGFGYDTSHVEPSEEHSELYNASSAGDLAKVRELISKTETRKAKLELVNHARKWTEVEYRNSGFTKEFEWYDRTPLMAAILRGHEEIVQYLLQEGADPVLKACYGEDAYTFAKEDIERAPIDQEKKDRLKVIIDIALKYYTYENHKHCRVTIRKFELPKEFDAMLGELRALEETKGLH